MEVGSPESFCSSDTLRVQANRREVDLQVGNPKIRPRLEESTRFDSV
jgi:hypothetical protein